MTPSKFNGKWFDVTAVNEACWEAKDKKIAAHRSRKTKN